MRTYSRKRYLLALMITCLIFVFGMMLGLVIEGERTGYLEEFYIRQGLEYQSLQMQYQFIDQLGQERNCDAMSTTFNLAVENLEDARQRLESFNQDATVNKGEFDVLKREYILAELRYWLLAKKTKVLCDMELSTILYFYSTEDACPDCDEQAFVLTYLKDRFKDRLLNFALDGEYDEEPMITILRETYDINAFPTIVVNDVRYEGFTDMDTILKEICQNYGEVKECEALEEAVIVS